MEKYQGVIPAFYACYDEMGNVDTSRVEQLTQYFIDQKVHGLYVGGSSGECIYQSVAERKLTLEHVMKVAKDKLTIIAHVACNNTADSKELARHAEHLGVDAIAAIPPIYFKLPEIAIAKYWNDISTAAPNTDFIIYNIPQLAGVSLTQSLLIEMLKNKRVIGVKNSSMPTQDIQIFKDLGGENFVVFNGPDEQFLAGRSMGATGGIGGTYAVMPTLFLKLNESINQGDLTRALAIQNDICRIIYKLCTCQGNLYAAMKYILAQNGIDIGSVREPLYPLVESDYKICNEVDEMIKKATMLASI